MVFSRLKQNKNSLWIWLLTSGVEESNPHLYTRLLFANSLMHVVAVILVFFIVFHFGFTGQHILGAFDATALLLVVFLYILLNVKKSIRLFGHYSAIGMLIFYFSFIPMTQNEDMSFVWVFFAPLLIILVNGWKVGLSYVLIFCAVVFPMAYYNIGIWDYGEWNSVHFYRLVAGVVMATAIAVMIDVAQLLSNKREQRTHQKEVHYLADLKRLSMTDGLTGLYNRHHFNKVFDDKVEKLQSMNHYLLFFIVDIDFFKAYNDSFGHQAGDVVIQKVANRLKEFVKRENDLVFRLGGEEFGGLIETRKPNETALWLSQLADEVKALKIPHSTSVETEYITISGGVSAMQVTEDFEKNVLYKLADDALYRAKATGRDQIVIDDNVLNFL